MSDTQQKSDAPAPGGAPSTAAEQFALRGQSRGQRVQQFLHAHPAISPLLLLVAAFVIFSLLNPRFASAGAQSLVLQQVAVIGALAAGQTLIILTAGIDLSVGAAAILAMLISAKVSAESGVPGPLAILLGLVIGTLAGLLNGVLVTRLRLPPFIVTLGTLSVFTAIALLYSGGQSIQGTEMPDLMTWTGKVLAIGDFRITTGVLMVIALYIGLAFALKHTAWGRHVYAVGDDAEAARLAGIRVNRVLLSVYTLAGLIYGLTAWIIIGRAATASPNAAVDANLESITAVVIGGTSLFGGRGAIIGTALGALIVGYFRSGLSLAGVDDQYRVLAIGVLVITAVAVDQWIRKVKA